MSDSRVSEEECYAMRLLYRDESSRWNLRVLSMTFQFSQINSVIYHITGECIHGDEIEPVRVDE